MVIFPMPCYLPLYTKREYLLLVLTYYIENLRVLFPTFETEIVIYSEGKEAGTRASVVWVRESGESVLIEGEVILPRLTPSWRALRALEKLFEKTMEEVEDTMEALGSDIR
ncbi:hypothetical protein IMZ48_42120 [Candidatus Bathyarchaeota archaeon]|nr:hypothetical protein [Candidatus Bathyarchaeota archaeon]